MKKKLTMLMSVALAAAAMANPLPERVKGLAAENIPWRSVGPGGGGWIQSILWSRHAKDRLFVFTRRDTGTRFANELIECRDRVAAAEKEAKRTGGEPVIPGSTVRGSALKIGMRVSHKWYGPGTVSGRTDVTVSVKFDIGTVREFVAASSDFDLI